MPKHYKGKTGVARKKAYAEHKEGKYQVGGEVTDLAEVIAEVAQMGQEFPTTNAMERSESYQLGGAVRPPTAPSITPTPQYKKGRKVQETNILDIVPKAEEYADIDKFNIEKYGQTWKQPYRKKGIEKMVGEVLSKKKKGKKK